MDPKVRRFQDQAREENEGRRGVQNRYSMELRREAVAYLTKRKRDGASVVRVAAELGVSGWSLVRWSRESDGGAALRRVKVSEKEPVRRDEELTLVTPEGYRIEGLDGRSAREFLEALR